MTLAPAPTVGAPPSRWRNRIYLAAQPVLMLIASLVLRTDRGPYWQARYFDPDYAYLFNALNVARLHAPYHIDHPGITVQVPGGVLLRSIDLVDRTVGRSSPKLVVAVARDPEWYLRALSDAMVTLAALSSFLAGVAVLRLGLPLSGALLVQGSWLLTPLILSHGIRMTPEAVFPILLPWMALLFVWYSQPKDVEWTTRTSVVAGTLIALLLATKVNALPWLVLMLLPGTVKGAAQIVGVAASALAILLLPIYKRVAQAGGWWLQVATHKGQYGSGDAGFVDVTVARQALREFIVQEPALFVVASLLLIALVRHYHRARIVHGVDHVADKASARRTRVLLVAALGIWGCIAITAKHPRHHYLLPATGVLGVALSLTFDSWQVTKGPKTRRWWPLALVCALSLWTVVLRTAEAVRDHEARVQTAKLTDAVLKVDSACPRVYHYRASSPAYALAFGDNFSGGVYSREIAAALPERSWTYDIWSKQLRGEGGQLPLDTLSKFPCVVVQGTPEYSPASVSALRVVRTLPGSWRDEVATVAGPSPTHNPAHDR
jgi:hypothetical protein